MLKQDPADREVVYAGTTEGLYKSLNGGKSFERMTGPEVIVNDVFVDPEDTKHVLLAVDRGGVLMSHDGGASFAPSNEGFSERRVQALLVDSHDAADADPPRLFAGVVNDKSFGGVFVSGDGGARWEQIADGLDGRDVFALAESPDGTILAGTNHGIFALDESAPDPPDASDNKPAPVWKPRNTIENTLVKTAIETHDGVRVHVEKKVKDTVREIGGRVYALDLSGDAWLASTTAGLFTSKDKGASWQGGPVMGTVNYLSVAAHGSLLAAVRQDGAVLSKDAGQSWMPMGIPAMLTRIRCVAFSPDGTLWLGAREGVYFTHDLGQTWLWVNRFPLNDVDDLTYRRQLGQDSGQFAVERSGLCHRSQVALVDVGRDGLSHQPLCVAWGDGCWRHRSLTACSSSRRRPASKPFASDEDWELVLRGIQSQEENPFLYHWKMQTETAASRPLTAFRTHDSRLEPIAAKVMAGERLDFDDGLALYGSPDVLAVGWLANHVRERLHGDVTYFNVNRHINPTNVCVAACKLCAFGRKKGDPAGYTMALEEAWETAASGYSEAVTEFHIVGGLHPDLPLEYFLDLVRGLKVRFPKVHIKAFTMVEVAYLARRAKLTIEQTLIKLRDAGVDSMPGGGAEIFAARVRSIICDHKIDGEEWLDDGAAGAQAGLQVERDHAVWPH